MTKSESLRFDAGLLEKEAKRLQRQAAKEARRGGIGTAEYLSLLAIEHEKAAAMLRVDSINHEMD